MVSLSSREKCVCLFMETIVGDVSNPPYRFFLFCTSFLIMGMQESQKKLDIVKNILCNIHVQKTEANS